MQHIDHQCLWQPGRVGPRHVLDAQLDAVVGNDFCFDEFKLETEQSGC